MRAPARGAPGALPGAAAGLRAVGAAGQGARCGAARGCGRWRRSSCRAPASCSADGTAGWCTWRPRSGSSRAPWRSRGQGRRERDHFVTLGFDVARAQFTPYRLDAPWEYYEAMSHWVESGHVQPDLRGTAFQPETDTLTFNGAMWLLARRNYLHEPRFDPAADRPGLPGGARLLPAARLRRGVPLELEGRAPGDGRLPAGDPEQRRRFPAGDRPTSVRSCSTTWRARWTRSSRCAWRAAASCRAPASPGPRRPTI